MSAPLEIEYCSPYRIEIRPHRGNGAFRTYAILLFDQDRLVVEVVTSSPSEARAAKRAMAATLYATNKAQG